jgi:glucose/arabinose dehydrogenase
MTDGQWLVTERPGRMRVINSEGVVSSPVIGLPEVRDARQGGLLDVAVSPDFATDRTVFWTYAKPVAGGSVTAAARGVLSVDLHMTQVRDIWQQNRPSGSDLHFGSRIIPMADGTVWITTGERSTQRERVLAQDLDVTYGKVIRVNWDGTVPADNPYVGRSGDDTIWSYGHRNIQGAAIAPDGRLWTIEHGPRGGDELNQPFAGRNYGWPVISYGINYNGSDVGIGAAQREGMEQPVYYWDPVIAPGGMTFYDGSFGPWQGDLLIGSLNPGALVRLQLQDGRVVGEERLLPDVGRVRDVQMAGNGQVLILVDDGDGAVLRMTPGG